VTAKSGLAKLVIFGDPKKGEVAKVISGFRDFVKGRAETIGECGIDECTVDILEEADFAVVLSGLILGSLAFWRSSALRKLRSFLVR